MISGLGPHEGLGVIVGDVDVAEDGMLEVACATEDTASELFLGESGKPPLDKVDPR